MEGKGAEVAPAKAPPVVGHGETDLLDRRHAAHGVVHGVDLPSVRQLGDVVQLLLIEGHGRGIHHQHLVPMGLKDGLAPDGVVLLVFDLGGEGVVPLIGAHRLIGGYRHRFIGALGLPGGVGGAPNIGEGLHLLPPAQPPGNLTGGPLLPCHR